MYSEPEDKQGDDPEIDCPPDSGTLPEPSLIKHAVPEAVYDVEHRVQLEDCQQLRAQHLLSVPHDRCKPYADLQHEDTDKLSKVAEKYIYRRSQIHETQRQNYITDDIIDQLERVKRRRKVHTDAQDNRKYNEK